MSKLAHYIWFRRYTRRAMDGTQLVTGVVLTAWIILTALRLDESSQPGRTAFLIPCILLLLLFGVAAGLSEGGDPECQWGDC